MDAQNLIAVFTVIVLATGINSQIVSKEGVCPYLPAPSYCRDSYDFCRTDDDCRLANYKCCSNGCKKICAVATQNRTEPPSDVAKPVRPGDCPVLPVRKFCFSHDSPECSNDFECKEYYKCCSNGCTRRCVVSTSTKAVESGQPSSKNATCPQFPANSSSCPLDSSNQCTADNDCSVQGSSFKCCWDGCRKICLDPSELQRTEANPHKYRLDDKCPYVPRPLVCSVNSIHQCFSNAECPNPLMCCSDGCRNICHDVTKDTSLLLCPISRRPDKCPAEVTSSCVSINDCESGQKCCFDGCNFRCYGRSGFQPQGPPPTTASPSTTSNPTTTFSPTTEQQRGTETDSGRTTTASPTTEASATEAETEAVTTKTATSAAATTEASLTELVTSESKTEARTTEAITITPTEAEPTTESTTTQYVAAGNKPTAGKTYTKPAPAKGQPKPGICPLISRRGIACPSNDQCGNDQDCASTKKCCRHFCGRLVCIQPPSREEEDRLMNSLYRPGKCRTLKTPDVCQKQTKVECNYDVDCIKSNQKCCSDGCNRRCTDSINSGPVIPRATGAPVVPGKILGRCPPYSPVRSCPSLVQDACTCTSDCGSGLKCCFDGCKRICRKPAGQVCSAQVDIVYLMDTSGSISMSDYRLEKQFVKDLARIFRVDVDASRAAVIIYNDDPHSQIKLGEHTSPDEFAKAIDAIPYLHGRTRIDKALKASLETFQSARPNVRKVLVLLTDGRQTQDPDVVALDVASKPLKDMGVKIYAVGVGHKIDKNELEQIASKPSDVFTVDSFTALLGESQTIAAKACGDVIGKICVRGVDLGFIVDSSESITDDDFNKEKNAIRAISDEFIISPQSTRAGVVVYSGKPHLSIHFDQYTTNAGFNQAVNDLPHMQSHTRLDMALRYAASDLYNKRRVANPSIAIVLTDGKQTPGAESLATAVKPLRDLGVRVFAVGVGPRVSQSELRQIVERYDDIFTVDSFSQLIQEAKKITERACPVPSDKTEAPPVTYPTTPAPTTTLLPTTTLPPPVTTSSPCSYFLDIIFVLDSSRSMDVRQYNIQKDFVKRLAKIFNVGQGTRAAAIIYSDDPVLSIDFEMFNNLKDFQKGIDELPYIMQRTRIDKALTMASQVLQDSRPGFPKVVIIMTDGRQTRDPDYTPLDKAAAPLHQAGARVLVVGIGPQISVPELELMVKNKSDVFPISSFDALVNAASDLAIKSCQVPVPTNLPDSCTQSFELVFVMDSSGSMLVSNFNKEKAFVKNVVGRFVVGPTKVSLGLLSFSDWPTVHVTFGSQSSVSLQRFLAAVDGAGYSQGRSRIDRALQAASDLIKLSKRQVPKVLVVLTDGRQSQDPGYVPIEQAVKTLIDQDVKIIVVGVGQDIDRRQLYILAGGQGRDVTQVSSFDDLNKLQNSFAQTICSKVEEIIQRGSP